MSSLKRTDDGTGSSSHASLDSYLTNFLGGLQEFTPLKLIEIEPGPPPKHVFVLGEGSSSTRFLVSMLSIWVSTEDPSQRAAWGLAGSVLARRASRCEPLLEKS